MQIEIAYYVIRRILEVLGDRAGFSSAERSAACIGFRARIEKRAGKGKIVVAVEVDAFTPNPTWKRGWLAVLSPHSVMGPGVNVAIRVGDGDNRDGKGSKYSSSLFGSPGRIGFLAFPPLLAFPKGGW